MQTVTAHLHMTLDIQVRTPAFTTKKPYHKRSSDEQHVVKMHCLQPLSVSPWRDEKQTKGILDGWIDLVDVGVDDSYQDTSEYPVDVYLQKLFDTANERLSKELGYKIFVGNRKPELKCALHGDGSRDVRHSFEVVVVTDQFTAQWVLSDDGVQAPVIAVIEWSVPAASIPKPLDAPMHGMHPLHAAHAVQPTEPKSVPAHAAHASHDGPVESKHACPTREAMKNGCPVPSGTTKPDRRSRAKKTGSA
jgi:hypothetical protein